MKKIFIKINNIIWQVFIDKDLSSDLLGLTSDNEYTIRLSQTLTKQAFKPTTIHELVHAFLYSYGFKLKKEFTDEDVCEFISMNIEQILEKYKKIENELLKEQSENEIHKNK